MSVIVAVVRRALLLSLLLIAAVRAQAPLIVAPGFQQAELTAYLALLEDPQQSLTLPEVRTSERFAGVPAGGTNLGFTRSAWWVRLQVHNTGPSAQILMLRQDYPLIDHLTLWAPDATGALRQVRTGDQEPFASRDIALRNFVFRLEVSAGAVVPVYLRYATSGSMDISLSLFAPDALFAAVAVEQLAYGVYYGAFLALIIYNLFIFLAVRDRVFIWYLLYALVFGLHFGVHNGFTYQFLWPDQPTWANYSLVVLLSLSLIFALQFTRGFLDTKRMLPRLDRVAMVFQGLATGLLVASFFLAYATVVLPAAQLTFLITALILIMGTRSLLTGYRPARYFMLAWAAMLFTVFAYILKAFGMLPHNWFTQNGFQIGSLLEMTLLSVALAARVRDLQKHSFSDPLTNLLNRRSFDHHLELEFARAMRSGNPVSLLMADIDHFKHFNDRYGHATGDEAIKLVARHLRSGVRQGDVVCRYGGEEFAVILPGADCKEAQRVAEKLRASLDSSVIGVDPITLSIGAACSLGEPFSNPDELFQLADEALYQAKAMGRNCVVRKHKGCIDGSGQPCPA